VSSLFMCIDASDGNPLTSNTKKSSIDECIDWAAGSEYLGFACPRNGQFNCKKGNAIDIEKVVDLNECAGHPNNNYCSGLNGNYGIAYKQGVFPLGGLYRHTVVPLALAKAQTHSLFTCYNEKGGRALRGGVKKFTSLDACLRYAGGHKYVGFGCPVNGKFECYRDHTIDSGSDSRKLGMAECVGSPQTDIGNGKSNGPCKGIPEKNYVIGYKGMVVPLGGWYRTAVATVASLRIEALLPDKDNYGQKCGSSGSDSRRVFKLSSTAATEQACLSRSRERLLVWQCPENGVTGALAAQSRWTLPMQVPLAMSSRGIMIFLTDS
jgi:hypothetical protein